MPTLFDYTASAFPDSAGPSGSDYGNAYIALQFTTTETILVTEYQLTVSSVTQAGDFKACLYDNNSVPDPDTFSTEVADTAKTITISSTGIKSFTLDTPKSLSAGTYWLYFVGSGIPGAINTKYVSYGQSHLINMNTAVYSSAAFQSALLYSASATIEQEGFRFRNDDGSESAATWKANQDTNITLAADTAFRLRFLLKATGNPDSIDAQADARVKPSGGAFGAWEKIN